MGNYASPVQRPRLKVSVVCAKAAREDLRMFAVRSSGCLFRDHQRAAEHLGNRAAATF